MANLRRNESSDEASIERESGPSSQPSSPDQEQAHPQDSNRLHNPQNYTCGVHGVRLKKFEKVVANVLLKVEPCYVCLPPQTPSQSPSFGGDSGNDDDWPFTFLPEAARVRGNNPGQLKNPKRAWRKEGQLRSMLRCILPLVPPDGLRGPDDCTTIVDFGGGSGHLAIPLALMLPSCRVIVVDFNERSLDLMHEKAASVTQEVISALDPDQRIRFSSSSELRPFPRSVQENQSFRSCATSEDGILNNLYSFRGPLEQFTEPFDVALALHLCGEATDVGLRKAAAVRAAAIVVAPCCVGKLSQKALNPDVYNATGQNASAVSYPQSSLLCQLVTHQDEWDALAKAADYSDERECGTSRNATRRTAKALLETDRRLFLEEQYGYNTALLRMQPFDVTPKNDILVAWRPDAYGDRQAAKLEDMFATPDLQCQADIEVAKCHLLSVTRDSLDNDADDVQFLVERNDWTHDEEEEVTETITAFLDRTKDTVDAMDQTFVFPTRMGGRKRKLIHFVAEQLKLAHWCQGFKDSEKTVVVARRGQRRRKEA